MNFEYVDLSDTVILIIHECSFRSNGAVPDRLVPRNTYFNSQSSMWTFLVIFVTVVKKQAPLPGYIPTILQLSPKILPQLQIKSVKLEAAVI